MSLSREDSPDPQSEERKGEGDAHLATRERVEEVCVKEKGSRGEEKKKKKRRKQCKMDAYDTERDESIEINGLVSLLNNLPGCMDRSNES